MTMEECIKQLGEHFIGLWTYQTYSRSMKKPRTYSVTVCINGNHCDTRDYKTPMRALQAAVKIMKELEQ